MNDEVKRAVYRLIHLYQHALKKGFCSLDEYEEEMRKMLTAFEVIKKKKAAMTRYRTILQRVNDA